jgi:hypothetical protein
VDGVVAGAHREERIPAGEEPAEAVEQLLSGKTPLVQSAQPAARPEKSKGCLARLFLRFFSVAARGFAFRHWR